jgi:plastocyanin
MIFSATLIASIIFSWKWYHLQIAAAVTAAEQTKSNDTTSIKTVSTSNTSAFNTINLSTKEVTDGNYKWINVSNAAQNLTIKVFKNSNNIIKIQNPTDTKHELIIDTGADVLPSSGDILPSSSGNLTFNPTLTGTFTYHCTYHPYMMKGTIEVVNK